MDAHDPQRPPHRHGDDPVAAADPADPGPTQTPEDLETETAVRDLLAAQPDPGPMPVDLARRIEAELARAGEVRASDRELFDELGLVEEPVDDRPDDLVVFGDAGDPPEESPASAFLRRRWPVLAAAAAAVVIAVTGVTLVGQNRSGTDGLASLPGASPTVSVATSVAGRLHVQASGAAYTEAGLPAAARAVLTSPGPEVGADQAATLGPLATKDGANDCVAALGDADAPSVSIDLATYAGQPAAIVVIARADKTTAYAVRRECATGDPEIIKDSVPVP